VDSTLLLIFGGRVLSIGIHGDLRDRGVKGTLTMEAVESSQVHKSRWEVIRPKLVATIWICLLLLWTGICIYFVATIVPTYTDNGHHSGTTIGLTYTGLRAISFKSDQPVTLQIGQYGHPFTFLNTDDGTIAQGIVVSNNIQNVSGHIAYQFGPQVVSQGHWKRVGGDDYDTTPGLTLASKSKISLTTYPSGHVWWVWTRGIVAGFLVWLIAGLCLAYAGDWIVTTFIALLFEHTPAP
jgi:hypothetical protein